MTGHMTIAVVKGGFIVDGEFFVSEERNMPTPYNDQRSIHLDLENAFSRIYREYARACGIQTATEKEEE